MSMTVRFLERYTIRYLANFGHRITPANHVRLGIISIGFDSSGGDIRAHVIDDFGNEHAS